VLLASGEAAWADVADERVMARAYQVRYRPLADAADVIAAVLTPDGTVTLRPRLNMLVVQDHPAILERVETLLQSFDLPPKNVDVTLSLFLGTERKTEAAGRTSAEGFSKEVRGVIDALGDVTKWVAYEPLGSRSVTGIEGDSVTAELSAEYRVTFKVQSVHESAGVVKFERVSLQRLEKEEDGTERVQDVYTAGMVLNAGRMHVVGAARQPGSDRALFLIVQVNAR
jgi:hypothetical protein